VGDRDAHRSKDKFKSFLFKTILDSLPQNTRGAGITIEHFPHLALSVTIARHAANPHALCRKNDKTKDWFRGA